MLENVHKISIVLVQFVRYSEIVKKQYRRNNDEFA